MKLRFPFIIAVTLVMALIVTSCTGPVQPEETNNPPQPTETPEPAQQPESTPEPEQPESTPESTPEPAEEPTPTPASEPGARLQALLPDKEGYKWVYNGFAEYGHDAVLEKIERKEEQIVYSAKGEVFDMSDGESDRDFSLSVSFIVTSDSLIQEKKAEMMLDLFDKMVLIQTPLKEGHSWTQTVKGSEGEDIVLECTIESVEDEDGAKVYTVSYQDKNGPYYEKRILKEGIGVVGYTRLYITEPEYENYEITYWLYEEASGYDK